MTDDQPPSRPGIPTDNPIREPGEDTIGRLTAAKRFVAQLLSLDPAQGFVVGVVGVWGSGKTSLLNLAALELRQVEILVVEFNPWMFGGAEQLVGSFFAEIAAQLKVHTGYEKLGHQLEEYGGLLSGTAWIPVVGPWIERIKIIFQGGAIILKHRQGGALATKRKLEKELRKRATPIVVILDDIDRLSTPEIREVFRLVRLTTNLPNLIYVLAFDRARVEKALNDDGMPGRDYLEKILLLTVDLPKLPESVLITQLTASMSAAVSDVDQGLDLDEDRWPDVFMEIIRPPIRHMRDVRRYAAGLRSLAMDLGGQIDTVDLFALEAIRVFIPEVFEQVSRSVASLTKIEDVGLDPRRDDDADKAILESVTAAAPDALKGVARAMLQRLFPATSRHFSGTHYRYDSYNEWLRQKRVAHEYLLRLFLERNPGAELSSVREAEELFGRFSKHDDLDERLRSVKPEHLRDVITNLELFENEFAPEHVVPAVTALLNVMPLVPEAQHDFFAFGGRVVVGRVTYRLLKRLKDPQLVEKAVKQILPSLKTLYGRVELLTQIGYAKNAGHKLIGEEAWKDLERQLRDKVRAASVEELAGEPNLFSLLMEVKLGASADEQPLVVAASPVLTLAVLRSARADSRTQALGTRSIKTHPGLAWDALITLYGNEKTLGARIAEARAISGDEDKALLDLATRYLAGWRPSRSD